MCAARNPVPRRRGRPPHDDVLTPAEWAVVHAVRHGMSYATIAAHRGISRDAVKFHVRNAVAKLGLRSRRDLQRWRGVPKDSAAFRRPRHEDPTMTARDLHLGPIGQISRTVRDIDSACAWYGKVLGLKHLYTFGKLAFFDCGGTRLYLSAESGTPTPESCLYLRVEDIATAHAELLARGVEFLGAPHMIYRHPDGTEEWMAFFKDPDGRALALMSQIPAVATTSNAAR
jgi:DNA-binding CsgD family transcriptional regulator/catechol 2,3-dioxygenase-like lactoylglutathione lyase family enzyme